MSYREFVCVESPGPENPIDNHKAFLLQVQKGILLSLEARGLLSGEQGEQCREALDRQGP